MSIYIELLLVAAIVTYIVGLSGFTDAWLGWLSRFTARYGLPKVRSLRPFSCPQCMVWWCCLAWCLWRKDLTLSTAATSAGLAFFSITIQNVCISIREGMNELLALIDRWMHIH